MTNNKIQTAAEAKQSYEELVNEIKDLTPKVDALRNKINEAVEASGQGQQAFTKLKDELEFLEPRLNWLSERKDPTHLNMVRAELRELRGKGDEERKSARLVLQSVCSRAAKILGCNPENRLLEELAIDSPEYKSACALCVSHRQADKMKAEVLALYLRRNIDVTRELIGY